jgi:hypothetical protein
MCLITQYSRKRPIFLFKKYIIPIGIISFRTKTVETHFRSIVKAISWRAGGTIITFIVAWVLAGSLELAVRIGDIYSRLGACWEPRACSTDWGAGHSN